MTEQQIITGCINEDRNCQRELYNRFAPKMLAVCMRYSKNKMEAEDLLQDGFIKVFNNVKLYSQSGSFEGWIRRIIVNNALNMIRKGKIDFQNIDENTSFNSADNSENAISKINEKDLLKIIGLLPSGYKYVFNMFAIEGYSHKEIADSLGIEESTSRSQYSKAKKFLQDKITQIEKINI